MKNIILKTAFVFTLLSAGCLNGSLAQELSSSKNYWVVETNVNQRNYSMVKFYNAANELIYEETLTGVYMNISRPKHVKRLNRALAQVTEKTLVASYGQKANQKNLIASLYRR